MNENVNGWAFDNSSAAAIAEVALCYHHLRYLEGGQGGLQQHFPVFRCQRAAGAYLKQLDRPCSAIANCRYSSGTGPEQ